MNPPEGPPLRPHPSSVAAARLHSALLVCYRQFLESTMHAGNALLSAQALCDVHLGPSRSAELTELQKEDLEEVQLEVATLLRQIQRMDRDWLGCLLDNYKAEPKIADVIPLPKKEK